MTDLVINIFNSILFTALYVIILIMINIRMKIDNKKRKFIIEKNLYDDRILNNELKHSNMINILLIGIFIIFIIMAVKSYLYLFNCL